jgi:hypothetical protein
MRGTNAVRLTQYYESENPGAVDALLLIRPEMNAKPELVKYKEIVSRAGMPFGIPSVGMHLKNSCMQAAVLPSQLILAVRLR